MKLAPLVAIALATVSTAAFAATEKTQDFVTGASIGGMFEIESSKLALDRSKNTEIRKLADMLVKDHTKANAELKTTLAKSSSDAKPASALDKKHAEMLAELKKADADEFDAEYLDAQEDAHEEAVNLFRKYASVGDDADLKEFAKKTVPTLEKHKDHVEKLDDKDVGDNL